MAVSGGHALRESLRQAQATKEFQIEVGFKGKFIASLAQLLEFGNSKTSLPERPAFRAGSRRLEQAIQDFNASRRGAPTHAQAVELAILMRDAVRRAYTDFHGAPLSERQKTRKEDTPFQDDELIGSEGPKLIGHIHAYVDGDMVG